MPNEAAKLRSAAAVRERCEMVYRFVADGHSPYFSIDASRLDGVADYVAGVTREAYPDLKANQNMLQLSEELTSTENKVAFARQAYNDSVMAYNTNIVKEADAPKGYKDLLDPKWKGKLVKAHPGYSGTSLTGTFAITKALGWDYLEKLSKQGVQQLQSTTATPKCIASGERAVMADGNEYNMFIEKEKGTPVEIVYAAEGSPLIVGPNALFKHAPNPNAARLFQSFCFSPQAQQLCIDIAGLRSLHPQVKEKAGRRPFGEIKKMKDDPASVEKQSEEIKTRYSKLFGV
jgi:ABC-type Fe3+ transport system substrate-binding protein